MPLSTAVRTLHYYAILLQSLCLEQNVELHWSMQPGVKDGCLVFSDTREAAFHVFQAAQADWLGLEGPQLVLVILCIRADYLKECILAGTMSRGWDSKLRVFRNVPLRANKYTITIDADVPFQASQGTDALPPAAIEQAPDSSGWSWGL